MAFVVAERIQWHESCFWRAPRSPSIHQWWCFINRILEGSFTIDGDPVFFFFFFPPFNTLALHLLYRKCGGSQWRRRADVGGDASVGKEEKIRGARDALVIGRDNTFRRAHIIFSSPQSIIIVMSVFICDTTCRVRSNHGVFPVHRRNSAYTPFSLFFFPIVDDQVFLPHCQLIYYYFIISYYDDVGHIASPVVAAIVSSAVMLTVEPVPFTFTRWWAVARHESPEQHSNSIILVYTTTSLYKRFLFVFD